MKEKLRVLAVAYPEESRKYQTTLCIAGITEDGDWRRLYPVPWTTYLELGGIPKRGWIDYELREGVKGERRDDRKESRKVKYKTIRNTGDPITAEELRDILQPQVTNIEHLRERYYDDFTSLGIIKPELMDMGFKINQAYTGYTQSKLSPNVIQVTQLKDKPQYRFRCHQSEACTEHKIICEDIEVGQLYRKYLRKEHIRHAKMKDKLFYQMQKNDLHFIVGTYAFQPTWLIVGLFYPHLPEPYKQTSLAN